MDTESQEYSYAVMAKKGATFIASWLAGYATVYGFELGQVEKAALATLIGSALTMLRNRVKMKWPGIFWWL